MMNHGCNTIYSIILVFLFNLTAWANESILPKSYMMEKYGVSKPYYCKLNDPIEKIACLSWDAALGVAHKLIREGKYDPKIIKGSFPVLFAINASNLIQQLVSYTNHLLYDNVLAITENPSDPYISLIRNHGRCGNHQLVFEEVLGITGIKNRKVAIYMEKDGSKLSHAVSEFYALNKWMFIDVTNGSLWPSDAGQLKLLSIEEIMKLRPAERLSKMYKNKNDLKNISHELLKGLTNLPQNQFDYLHTNTKILGLLYNASGVVKVNFSPKYNPLAHQPNYIGSPSIKEQGISLVLTQEHVPIKYKELELIVSGVGGCKKYGSIIKDEKGNEFVLRKGKNYIKTKGSAFFSVKRDPKEICYIVFSDIKLMK